MGNNFGCLRRIRDDGANSRVVAVCLFGIVLINPVDVELLAKARLDAVALITEGLALGIPIYHRCLDTLLALGVCFASDVWNSRKAPGVKAVAPIILGRLKGLMISAVDEFLRFHCGIERLTGATLFGQQRGPDTITSRRANKLDSGVRGRRGNDSGG